MNIGNITDELNKKWEWEKTTPLLILSNWERKFFQSVHLGSLSYYSHKNTPRFCYGSVGYEFSAYKPFAKFADEDTVEKLKIIDEKLKVLKEERALVCKEGFKKSKKALFESDVLKMIEQRKVNL